MAELLFIGLFLLAIFNAGFLAKLTTFIITGAVGNNPISRLLKLVLGFLVFAGYGYISIYKLAEFWGSIAGEVSPVPMILLLALPLVPILLMYLFQDEKQ